MAAVSVKRSISYIITTLIRALENSRQFLLALREKRLFSQATLVNLLEKFY